MSVSKDTPGETSQPTKDTGGEMTPLRHPVHRRFHGDLAPSGIWLANIITGAMGSWTFLVIQTIAVICWLGINVLAAFHHFDPYPFILLNLGFSVQAAYAAPLILMAGNVAAARDRELWEHDYTTNRDAYSKILDLERQIQQLAIQNQQLLEQLSIRPIQKVEG